MASDTGSDGILVGRGAAVSCFVLGTCHRLGRLLPQDAERAAMYYKKVSVHVSMQVDLKSACMCFAIFLPSYRLLTMTMKFLMLCTKKLNWVTFE